MALRLTYFLKTSTLLGCRQATQLGTSAREAVGSSCPPVLVPFLYWPQYASSFGHQELSYSLWEHCLCKAKQIRARPPRARRGTGAAPGRRCPRRAAELPSAGAPQAAGGGGGGHAGSRVPALPLSGRGGEGGPAPLLGRTPRGPPRRLPLRAPLPPRAPPRPCTDPEGAVAAPRGALP